MITGAGILPALEASRILPSTRGQEERSSVVSIQSSITVARFVRGMEDSHFREARTGTILLLKLKRHDRQLEASQKNDKKHVHVSGDILENKCVIDEYAKSLGNLSYSYKKRYLALREPGRRNAGGKNEG